MLIYNTTFIVPNSRLKEWLKWTKEIFIPFMLRHNFSDVRIARVLYNSVELSQDDEKLKEDDSFSVQFQIESLEKLNQWEKNFEDDIFRNLYEHFSTEILTFSTVLESLS